MPGRHFILQSEELGSLDRGSPVYYRGIKVGQVVDYNFDHDRDGVDIKIFIEAPFHEKVLENSRFWNASGIDMTMDATGIKLDTQSLVSIMLGGVAFDLRKHDEPGEPAEKDSSFRLYSDQASSKEESYDVKRYYVMYFDQSVRGLSPGAPVEISGIQVGEVVSVKLQFDQSKLDFRIPVVIVLEPERLDVLVTGTGEVVTGKEMGDTIEEENTYDLDSRARQLIKKGLRGQLKTGNLLTGQLYVDIDFYPEAPPAELEVVDGHMVFPTIPAPLEQIVQRVDNILKKVEQVPFGKIGKELQVTMAELATTLKEVKGISGKVNEETIPKVNASLDQLQESLKGIESTLGPDSALNYNTRQVTSELALAIRSIRSLLEYLERDPQALILGKEGDKK
jgi:paraquat-inducible protein B